jgi:hypothetical protein
MLLFIFQSAAVGGDNHLKQVGNQQQSIECAHGKIAPIGT